MMEDTQDKDLLPPTMRQSKIVKEIMGKVVAAKLSMNYAGANAAFALFCHDNDEWRDHLPELWFVERLAEFAMLTKKRNTHKNVSYHAAGKAISVRLYCPISPWSILVTFSQHEPGAEGKIKFSQILWGLPPTARQRVRSCILIG